MQYSVCLPAVLSKMEVNEALAAVKAAGFEQYEIWVQAANTFRHCCLGFSKESNRTNSDVLEK